MEGPWRSFKGINSANKTNTGKDPWRYGCSYLETGDSLAFLGELSWPPRLYTCSFCKKEFRSAQALGGHMNVHRRDRARLRESPPPREPLASDRNPNHEHGIPNLNYPPEPPPLGATGFALPERAPPLPCPPRRPPFASSKCCNVGGKVMKVEGGEGGSLVRKTRTTLVRLELEIGLCSGGGGGGAEVEEELDLELRLGYA